MNPIGCKIAFEKLSEGGLLEISNKIKKELKERKNNPKLLEKVKKICGSVSFGGSLCPELVSICNPPWRYAIRLKLPTCNDSWSLAAFEVAKQLYEKEGGTIWHPANQDCVNYLWIYFKSDK